MYPKYFLVTSCPSDHGFVYLKPPARSGTKKSEVIAGCDDFHATFYGGGEEETKAYFRDCGADIFPGCFGSKREVAFFLKKHTWMGFSRCPALIRGKEEEAPQ